VKRGEIRWYTFRLPDKRRPVLVLTRNDVIDRLNEIIVVSATRTIRGLTTEVVLTADDGMPAPCALNFDHVALAQRDSASPPSHSLNALHEQGHEICLSDLLSAYRRPCAEDLFGGFYLRQRVDRVEVLCKIVICEVAVFLKLAERSSHESEAGHNSGIFAGKGEILAIQDSVGSGPHDAVVIGSAEGRPQ
jgi:mRNA interferase MazF